MANWMLSFPAAVKLGLVLLAIVALMRTRLPRGLAFLAGALFLAFLFQMMPLPFAESLVHGLISDQTLFLLVIVVVILIFSGALNATGQFTRIIESFEAMVGESRLTLITFPALIGLLPMPGGAVFSAPMVEAAAKKANLAPEQVTIANYWFRHIWEYWFPLYPGVILALALTGVSTWKFLLMQMPLTVLAVAAGYVIILHRVKLGGRRQRDYSARTVKAFIRELSPILIVVAVAVPLDPFMGVIAKAVQTENMLLRYLPMLLGLMLGGAWLFPKRGLTWATLGGLVRRKNIVEMALLVAGMMMFKAVLDDSGAVTVLRTEFEAWNIPLVAVVCVLPFMAGLVIGIAVGYVSTSFAVVIALLAAIPASERFPYYCLAYSIGYAGMMLSPLHLCLVLTNNYFKSSLLRVYCYLVPLSLFIALCSGLSFVVYRAVEAFVAR